MRRGVPANAISLAGMLAGLGAGVLFAWAAGTVAWLAGAVLVQARLLANMLDGMVAIDTGTASPRGELFNEIPDRVSDTAILVGLGWGAGAVWLGWAAALAAMFTAYVRAVGRIAGGGSQFCGPMAKQQRMAAATLLAVWAAFVPRAWAPPALFVWGLGAVAALSLLTALRRLGRIASALRISA